MAFLKMMTLVYVKNLVIGWHEKCWTVAIQSLIFSFIVAKISYSIFVWDF